MRAHSEYTCAARAATGTVAVQRVWSEPGRSDQGRGSTGARASASVEIPRYTEP